MVANLLAVSASTTCMIHICSPNQILTLFAKGKNHQTNPLTGNFKKLAPSSPSLYTEIVYMRISMVHSR